MVWDRLGEISRLEAILTSLVDGVLAVDRDLRVILLNRAAEMIFKQHQEDVLGRPFSQVADLPEVERLLRTALLSGHGGSMEARLLPECRYYFNVRVAPIKEVNQEGKLEVTGAVAVFHDITDTYLFNQMRSEFVANVSHELRTPLTSIKGFVETLLDGALEDEILCRRFLTIIDNETDRLSRLIDDLLTLSALEFKERKLNLSPVNLVEVAKTIMNVMSPQAADKKLRLELITPPNLPCVNADEDLIGQVFINLVDNAIKYTPENGAVTIRIREEDGMLVTRVTDTGPGIPEESLGRLFERFYRVDKARSRELGGTGLGLAIVKHIVESHGGAVAVESELGKGSTFIFSLKLGGLNDEPGKPASTEN